MDSKGLKRDLPGGPLRVSRALSLGTP